MLMWKNPNCNNSSRISKRALTEGTRSSFHRNTGVGIRGRAVLSSQLLERQRKRTDAFTSMAHYSAASLPDEASYRAPPVVGDGDMAEVVPLYRRIHELFQSVGGPALELRMGPASFLCLREAALIKEVLSDSARFPKGELKHLISEIVGDSVIGAPDGAQHRKQREVLAPHFRSEYIRNLVPCFNRTGQVAAETLEAAGRGGRPVDVESMFARVVLDNFGRTDLGHEFHAVEDMVKPHGERHLYEGKEFLELWIDMLRGAGVLAFGAGPREEHPEFPAYKFATDTIRSIIRQNLDEARVGMAAGSSRADLVTTLLRVQQSGTADVLTDQQIEDELMAVLFGAFDTSAGAMAWTLYRLANDPERQQAAVDEVLRIAEGRAMADLTYADYKQMVYLTACVNESMRVNPPAPETLRVAAEDTVIAGQVPVPKGAVIMTCFYAMHHNEALFEKEGEWIPERWLPDGPKELQPKAKDALMPFGAGARACPGRQYAMLAMPVLLAQVLGRVRVGRAEGAPEARIGQALAAKSVDGVYVSAEQRR